MRIDLAPGTDRVRRPARRHGARTSARHGARHGVRLGIGLPLVLALAACNPSVTVGPTSQGTPFPSPTPNLVTASPSPTPTSTVAIDPSLLAILPATVDGIELVESPEAESAALAGPELAAVGSAMAAGLAVDAATGQFVYAVVVRLKPAAMNDTVFRDWRDSYDEGACSQAGGVTGHAEAQFGGRTVFIGSCSGGVRTYHVWLVDQGGLISASAVGERRLGELLMENLRP